jgi:hypothetical protein
VGVPKGHPLFGKDYDECPVDIHGGLTFAGSCQHSEHGICHVVEEGEEDLVWWLGFDCGHLGDYLPIFETPLALLLGRCDLFGGGHYWTYAEVKEETEKLALQLANMHRK